MRILWFTNIALPIIANDMNGAVSNGGGWLSGVADAIRSDCEKELTIVFPIDNSKGNLISGRVEELDYFGIPVDKFSSKFDEKIVRQYAEIIEKIAPDCIHIWGTEYLHSYYAMAASKKCGLEKNTVVSIQGLVSVYAKHFISGIPENIAKRKTIGDIIQKSHRTGIWEGKTEFEKRGIYEEKTLQLARHIIGRTDWDRACSYIVNPSAEYHFCNETLRNSFYENQWSLNEAEKYSIFVSQAGYSVKGFHYMIEALEIIKRFFPKAKLYTTGSLKCDTIKDRIRIDSYSKYLMKLIQERNMEDSIFFVGNLDEKEMCQQYMRSHVFVSPSTIENSPNSLGEAMILGMPVVSSDVGGVKNMLNHGQEGYVYQMDAPYMLAFYVMKIFEDDRMACEMGKSARNHALQTHNAEKNYLELMTIYNKIKREI